eukprot:s331_g19.t1
MSMRGIWKVTRNSRWSRVQAERKVGRDDCSQIGRTKHLETTKIGFVQYPGIYVKDCSPSGPLEGFQLSDIKWNPTKPTETDGVCLLCHSCGHGDRT